MTVQALGMRLGIKGLTELKGRYYINRRINGKPTRIPLSRVDAGEAALIETARLLPAENTIPLYVGEMLRLFVRDGLPTLVSCGEIKQSTADQYQRFIECDRIGMLATFGHIKIEHFGGDTMTHHLSVAKERRRARAGNYEKAVMSCAFRWAMGRKWGVKFNPCHGVRQLKIKKKRVDLSNDGLIALHAHGSAAFQLLVAGAYYSGMRYTDLEAIRRDQVVTIRVGRETKHFLKFTESKTGKDNELEIGPALGGVINAAIAHGDALATKITKKLPVARPLPETIFVNSRGVPWGYWAMRSEFVRTKGRAKEAGKIIPFSFRKLRNKAQTDAAKIDSTHNVLGHAIGGQLWGVYVQERRLKSVA